MALSIGLNSVDSNSYKGWKETLNAPENDAEDLTSLADSQGFKVTRLVTMEATYENVINKLKMAKSLQKGDIFMLSYSGFGGELPNMHSETYLDKTLCLFDRQLRHREILYLLTKISEGVRIVLIFDSCVSGTIAVDRGPRTESNSRRRPRFKHMLKFVPNLVLAKHYNVYKEDYEKEIHGTRLKNLEEKIKSPLIMMTACQANQFAEDGGHNSLFISKLLDVWNNGSFDGSYKTFYKSVVSKMPSFQTPYYFQLGKRNQKFVEQKPFTI